jgi:hypothetical protein
LLPHCFREISILQVSNVKWLILEKQKIMVAELKKVISTIEKLEDDEQRQIAKMLSDEISWDVTLQNSQEKLSNLAEEALNEYKTGKTQQTDW